MSEIEKLVSDILSKQLNQIFATGAVPNLINIGKQMSQEVQAIDAAMTDLYRVTNETSEGYNRFLTNACGNAQKLGKSVSTLIEQTTSWSKLGYSLKEAESLSHISSIYSNISKVDTATAIYNISTAMNVFGIEASNAITIIDKLNTLSNKYSISANDLGSILTSSASALSSAGNDIDESLALITALSKITKNASEASNVLETLSTHLDEIETKNQITNLTGGKVDTTNLKSTYDIMQSIGCVWNDMNATNQSELLETITGNQNTDAISSLLLNMSQANNALNDSLNSSGSAYKEHEQWMNSLGGKTQQFESAFQSLSSKILDSDLLKWFIDFGTGTINVIENVVDTFGSLGTIGIGTSLFAGFKNVGRGKMFPLTCYCLNMPTIICVL